jgi:hypothetical protein
MVTNKGRLKPKKLASLQQSLSERDLGPYSGGKYASVTGQSVVLQQVLFDELKEGINRETIVVGKVVGVITAADSITSQTLAVVDKTGSCVVVTIYQMASQTAPVIGNSIAIPEPVYQVMNVDTPQQVSLCLGCLSDCLTVIKIFCRVIFHFVVLELTTHCH